MARCSEKAEQRVRVALLYEPLGDKVQCHTYERRCHRRFIAVELEKQGGQVNHIIDQERVWLPRKDSKNCY